MRFSHTHIAKQLSELAGQQESNCNWVLPLSIADAATAVGMGEKAAQHPVTWQLLPPRHSEWIPQGAGCQGMGEWGNGGNFLTSLDCACFHSPNPESWLKPDCLGSLAETRGYRFGNLTPSADSCSVHQRKCVFFYLPLFKLKCLLIEGIMWGKWLCSGLVSWCQASERYIWRWVSLQKGQSLCLFK